MTNYPAISFEGTIKEMRGGGWAARGVVVAIRHGQIFDTQVGPQQFDTEGQCDGWLRAAAARLNIDRVEIAVMARADA